MTPILIATHNQDAAGGISRALSPTCRAQFAGDREAFFKLLPKGRFEFLFVDLDFLARGEAKGAARFREAINAIKHHIPSVEIVVLSRQSDIRLAVDAVRAGAANYLSYPLDSQEVAFVTESLLEMQQVQAELKHLRESHWRGNTREGMHTNNPKMMDILDKVETVAPTISTVLLLGETGTGKSMMAKMIHGLSNRSEGPFISVHCGAIPDTLVESELFGHEKGAFTGADRRRLGKFQAAEGGTIFLDEVGTISMAAQVRLLQVLQEKQFTRVGGDNLLDADVRIIAASNEDLGSLCDLGRFRRDLFYRLNVFPLRLPPLRERPEDIPGLVDTFIKRLNQTHGKSIWGCDPRVLAGLASYDWPGNIRELANLVERAFILAEKDSLSTGDFPSDLFAFETGEPRSDSSGFAPLSEVRQRAVDEAEWNYLRDLLQNNRGSIKNSAAIAGLTTRQLHNLLNKHGIKKSDFK